MAKYGFYCETRTHFANVGYFLRAETNIGSFVSI